MLSLVFGGGKDPNLGLQKIAKFFSFSVNEEEIKSVVENCSFKAMKQKSTETHGTFGDVLFRKGKFLGWGGVDKVIHQ